jgi:hypothetical protein
MPAKRQGIYHSIYKLVAIPDSDYANGKGVDQLSRTQTAQPFGYSIRVVYQHSNPNIKTYDF